MEMTWMGYNFNLEIGAQAAPQILSMDQQCFNGGLSYHIHEKWTHSTGAELTGNCGAAYTGGHMDTNRACGPASGNLLCATKGGCIGGTTFQNPLMSYNCNPTTYAADPMYSCENGDLSGKYGKAA